MNNSSLKDFPQAEYEALLGEALNGGVHIVHYRTGRKGGATVAWRRVGDDARNRMVEVAIAFCSPKDVFVRRIGTLNALSYFFDGAVILMPIGSTDSASINDAVRRIAGMALYATSAYLYTDQ
jgi:hypothetical protein